MAKLTIAEVNKKQTKNGNYYLLVKSSNGNLFSIWDSEQAIWHLFKVGETLDVTTSSKGKFTSITGVVGQEREKHVEVNSGAGNSLLNATIDPTRKTPNAFDWIVEKLKEIEKKVDFLVDEQKTVNSLNAQEINLHAPLPNLSDLPEYNLEDR